MTDLQKYVEVLNKGADPFSKEKLVDCWLVTITTRNIKAFFEFNGDYIYMKYEKPTEG